MPPDWRQTARTYYTKFAESAPISYLSILILGNNVVMRLVEISSIYVFNKYLSFVLFFTLKIHW